MFTGDYLLTSTRPPASIGVCPFFGACIRIDDHSGQPAYKHYNLFAVVILSQAFEQKFC